MNEARPGPKRIGQKPIAFSSKAPANSCPIIIFRLAIIFFICRLRKWCCVVRSRIVCSGQRPGL